MFSDLSKTETNQKENYKHLSDNSNTFQTLPASVGPSTLVWSLLPGFNLGLHGLKSKGSLCVLLWHLSE